jgi:hypothetical protein
MGAVGFEGIAGLAEDDVVGSVEQQWAHWGWVFCSSLGCSFGEDAQHGPITAWQHKPGGQAKTRLMRATRVRRMRLLMPLHC